MTAVDQRMAQQNRFAVIGAGAAGLCAAKNLIARGYRARHL